MSNVVIIILACCAIALLFLALGLFFRMLNRVGRKKREKRIRRDMDLESEDSARGNLEQKILMQRQLSQDTNTVQNERRS